MQQPDLLRDLEQKCRKNGLRLTSQRRLILESLASRRDHPTADLIWEQVRREAPELSRTTVYRVLETLVNIGIARRTCHPDAVTRYELNAGQHHHLVCLRCGKMVDVEEPSLNQLRLPEGRLTGFQIADYSVQFRGTCLECRKEDA